jgi:hypothetical protein
MKTLKQLGIITAEEVRNEAISAIKEILTRHKEIDIEDITPIGNIETGEFQYKISKDIQFRQIVTLLAYLMWFYDIKKIDVK